jgi:hypothetical protein
MNRDFSPILYYYYLRHWMSQFNVRFGPVQVGLLVLLGFYLVRLRGSAYVLFASGFAASALEVVLLLAFQVLCGSVYQQVGVIVTVFMAGLALGALMANQLPAGAGSVRSVLQLFGLRNAGSKRESPFPLTPALSPREREDSGQRSGETDALGAAERRSVGHPLPKGEGRGEGEGDAANRATKASCNSLGSVPTGSLPALALAIAGYAVVLPLFLSLLSRLGGTAASLALVKVVIAALTLVLAMLVGMQFPLANRLEFDGTVAGASRLYTADFVGAFLGALLACTLLIPLIGVVGVCLLTAALNLAAGLVRYRAGVVG